MPHNPREHAGSDPQRRTAPVVPARPVAATPRALILQRMVGNRAAGRVLARWAKHPDPEKKSVMVPDVVAQDFERFNPPQNT